MQRSRAGKNYRSRNGTDTIVPALQQLRPGQQQSTNATASTTGAGTQTTNPISLLLKVPTAASGSLNVSA